MPVSEANVRAAMRAVIDPELGDDLVDLGMYRGADIAPDGSVTVHVALTTAGCPLRAQIQRDVKERIGNLPGVTDVEVRTSEMSQPEKKALMARARQKAAEHPAATDIPARTRVLAVSSGKGGVGKSSITVNLAAGLASRGYTVGVLDADIAGFSVPRMLGVSGALEARRPAGGSKPRMEPLVKRFGAGQVRVVSMGFLSPEDEAIMWRGLMINRGVQHFLEDVSWGDLDYLLVDMPPGTGDVQMGLARMLPRAEMIIVTTPALAAQKVAARAADMARKGYLRVAGVVENMSGFVCAHGERYELFGSGGGDRLARDIGVPLLARVPLEPEVSAGGDRGVPASVGGGPPAEPFERLVDAVIDVAPVIEIRDCTARMLDAVQRRLDEAVAASPAAGAHGEGNSSPQ
ncbi:MAG TPA: Mrp/NBP35 family ATP-binding protein [Acidimicrobiales bacterium]|nr:Mrp/NBP35 family ATP-binding protein [Acidimicrobiales bacterium]